MIRVGIGQDSHRFDFDNPNKPLMVGGVEFPDHTPLQGNSDADVLLHALTNSISSITGKNIIGKISDKMCRSGITDSREYLKLAIADLGDEQIVHVAISIECRTPLMSPKIPDIKVSIATLLNIKQEQIGITATSGEGLTAFGRGEGVQASVIITTEKHESR